MSNDKIQQVSDILKVLSDPSRLRLLRLLNDQTECKTQSQKCHHDAFRGEGFLCVNALSIRLGVTQSAVSQHLRILRQVGLVRTERMGPFARYTLNRSTLKKYGKLLHAILEEIGFDG